MLRVGVMIDSYICHAWIAQAISDLKVSDFARIELVVANAREADNTTKIENPSKKDRLPFLFRVYERWDYKRSKVTRDALTKVNLLPMLEKIPAVYIQPKRDEAFDYATDDQVSRIGAFHLDVLLRFSFQSFQKGMLGAARFGIWSLYPDDTQQSPRRPVLFWQIFDHASLCESFVRIQTPEDAAGLVALRSYASTDSTSLYLTRNPVYWKAADLILRGLRDLNDKGADFMLSLRRGELDECVSSRKLRNTHMICFAFTEAFRRLTSRVKRLRSSAPPKWCIAVRLRMEGLSFDSPKRYEVMPSPRDRFYADPFLFEKNGKTYLFFEDFRYLEGRAVISCCELYSDGSPGIPVEVLRRSYHLSYPFLFEDEGEIYMIPETRSNRTIEVYRATDFPRAWQSEGAIFDNIDAVDTTIQKIDGKFWMFTGLSNGRFSNSDELSLFSASALMGPWCPHPKNPIVSDVRRARPAGMLFYENGRLIRPSQDCSKCYGYALVFSEILTLSESEYEEKRIGGLTPEVSRHALATHTYNRTRFFEVVDRTIPARIADKAR